MEFVDDSSVVGKIDRSLEDKIYRSCNGHKGNIPENFTNEEGINFGHCGSNNVIHTKKKYEVYTNDKNKYSIR